VAKLLDFELVLDEATAIEGDRLTRAGVMLGRVADFAAGENGLERQGGGEGEGAFRVRRGRERVGHDGRDAGSSRRTGSGIVELRAKEMKEWQFEWVK
jgi:hypothetical protein